MILLSLAVAFVAVGGVVAWSRQATHASRYPRTVRSRAGTYQPRKSHLVTALKAAGIKVKSDYLGHALAELFGAGTGHTARAAGRGARWGGRRAGRAGLAAGRWAERRAGARWQARHASGPAAPVFWWHRHRGSGDQAGTPDGQDQAGPADAGSQAGAAADAAGQAAPTTATSDGVPPAGGTTPPAPAAEGPVSPSTAPAGARLEPTRARKEIRTMRHRYSINLERPATDAEFLESCVQLGDVLKALAQEVSDWAEGLFGLHLPPSVINPLHVLCEGIQEAATGASQAAKAFEDEFEDARDVAAAGMHFTGQDAA